MKKIILATLVAFSALAANAQIWVGGSIGFNNMTPDYDGAKSTLNLSIAPEVGYTLNDSWDIAVALNYNMIQAGDADAVNAFSIAPYARWTFAKVGVASFFLDGGLSFGTNANDNTSFGIGVTPGVKFALNDKVCLVGKLGGLGYKAVKNEASVVGLSANDNLTSLGVYVSF